MRPVFVSILLSFLSLAVSGQSKIKKDASSIKEMCGCFEVTFEFSETFIYSKDTLYKPSKNKKRGS